MTTQNFRVNQGLQAGDIVVNSTNNQITGLATSSYPNNAGDAATKTYVDSKTYSSISNSTTSVTAAGSGSSGTTTIVSGGTTNVVFNNALALFSTDVRMTGQLIVDGTQTIVNSTTLAVQDNIIEVNHNASSAGQIPTFSGLKVNRGELSTPAQQDIFWVWDNTYADDASTIFAPKATGAWTALRSQNIAGLAGGADAGPSPVGSPTDVSGNQDSNYVDIVCRVLHATATAAMYSDIAERFAADEPMTLGAVVMLGGSQEITQTNEDLSDKVFGVISDKPAYMMNAAAGNDESHPFVAMTGRTPVRVIGAVKKGERLVSSSVKGTARAAKTGEAINPFHVIGRALESKTDEGIGLVNCTVRTNN